jgi:hypothetical protein
MGVNQSTQEDPDHDVPTFSVVPQLNTKEPVRQRKLTISAIAKNVVEIATPRGKSPNTNYVVPEMFIQLTLDHFRKIMTNIMIYLNETDLTNMIRYIICFFLLIV